MLHLPVGEKQTVHYTAENEINQQIHHKKSIFSQLN